MAGKVRVKISLEHVDPYWMLVDQEENPLIVNIQEKIQQRLENVNITSLFLDGCLLPSDEPSELLRDGDTVHVIVSECEDQPDVNGSPQCKRHRKRKYLGETAECVVSDSQSSPSKCIATSGEKKGLKRTKDKKERAPDRYDGQTKEKKRRKKTAEQAEDSDANDGKRKTNRLSSPVHENRINKTPSGDGTDANVDTEKESEMVGIAKSTPVPEVTKSQVDGQRKRRRRGRKKSNSGLKSQSEEKSAKTLTTMKQTPAELRIPKWQKAQNKKIVFSSEAESPDESGDSFLKKQVNSQNVAGKVKSQSTVSDQTTVPLDTSDNNSSFSECFPSSSSLNVTEGSLVERRISQDATGNMVRPNAGTEVSTIKQGPDAVIAEDVNGSSSASGCAETDKRTGEENWEDDWYRDQQYQEKLTEEMNLKRPCPSALNKSLTPVHLYTGGHHEVVQPNLAEYLKLSPEERGATVPPHVTARRLSNGAMLYSRSPVAVGTDPGPGSSPFKKPACVPAKASPRALTKQQQLDTINTNTSIIVQNSPKSGAGSNAGSTESEEARAVNPPAERKNVADGQETIILTPVRREYSLFADLTAAPKAGDHIAYKVLEMGDDYTPGISDFKEAKVLNYDASSQNVTVQILNLHAAKKTPGKFDLPDENPPEEEATLELSSMFEPKLISSN